MNNDFYTKLMAGLFFIGAIILQYGYPAILAAYGVIITGLVGLILILLIKEVSFDRGGSDGSGIFHYIQVFFKYLGTVLPLVLIIGALSWMYYLLGAYNSVIENNRTPEEYKNFASAFDFILFFELAAVIVFVRSKLTVFDRNTINKKDLLSAIHGNNDTILYGFIFFSYVMVAFMNVILKFYITDG